LSSDQGHPELSLLGYLDQSRNHGAEERQERRGPFARPPELLLLLLLKAQLITL
jgi:hypothetical protein